MKNNRMFYIFISTLIVSVLLTGGISYGQKVTTEKPVEVLVGTHRDVTGPISAATVRLWRGFDWYLEWLEKNDPIPGIKVKIFWEDTGYSADRYLPTYKKFKQAGAVIQIHGSSTASSVLAELERMDKMPSLASGCGYIYMYFPKDIKKKGPSYLFSDRPPYADSFASGAMYFLKKWKEAGYKEKPKAVFTGWDSGYARGPIKLATPYLAKQGFEMLQPQIYAVTTTDLSSQCLAFKRQGANLIMSNVTEKFFAMLLKDAKKAGIATGIGPGKAIFIGGSETNNPTTLKIAGDTAEGAWAVSCYPSFNWDHLKAVRLMKEFQMKNLGEVEEHPNYFMGMGWCQWLWQVLKRTVKQYGPENITSATIYKTLISVKDLDMIGIMPNISYGPYERRPYKKYLIHEVQNGKWNVMTPKYIDLPQLIPEWEEAGLPGYRVKKK